MGEGWVINLEAELNKIDPTVEIQKQKKQCIYRVPKILRDLNKDAYTPQLISFGPYHHGADHLKPMEHQKRRALANYLRRSGKTIGMVAEAMRPEVKELMDCYDELQEEWEDVNKFLELMILDGCFFLDLMIWHTLELKPYMTIRLWMDMLRLENQLPLAVLAVLIEVRGKKAEDNKKFVKYYLNTPDKNLESIRCMGLHHLDIHRKYVTNKGDYYYDPCSSVRPATELFQAGVHFVRSDSESLKDISFQNGILRLPFYNVDENTEPLLLNYLAYEEILNVDNEVTSYAFLMDDLIDTAQDVVLLREKGIIKAWVGSDDETASLFNRLTKAMTFANKTSTVNVNKNLDAHCNRRWHKWRASFMQTYLSNPWVFISLLGASVMLFLSAAQTVFAILPYYKNS